MSLPYRNNKKKRSQSYILIGDGFDELEVVYFLHKFRRAGLSIKSVSLFDKLVFSRQGVGLRADYALSERPFDPTDHNCLLILPTGGRNGDVLRRDARVKSLLQAFDGGDGRIAITNSGSDLASDVGQLMRRPTYQPHMDQDLGDFVESLAERTILA
ncbi:MAG: DJ-1/PfpI family protein [Chloroflexi bacterium]|nr:DJ-1/PfpI family protein [Chloroflexota bacterium]